MCLMSQEQFRSARHFSTGQTGRASSVFSSSLKKKQDSWLFLVSTMSNKGSNPKLLINQPMYFHSIQVHRTYRLYLDMPLQLFKPFILPIPLNSETPSARDWSNTLPTVISNAKSMSGQAFSSHLSELVSCSTRNQKFRIEKLGAYSKICYSIRLLLIGSENFKGIS